VRPVTEDVVRDFPKNGWRMRRLRHANKVCCTRRWWGAAAWCGSGRRGAAPLVYCVSLSISLRAASMRGGRSAQSRLRTLGASPAKDHLGAPVATVSEMTPDIAGACSSREMLVRRAVSQGSQ
jgi:hypothetical protein